MSITILAGDVRDMLAGLPDNSIQCCVTSPPYFGLRSYLPADHPDKAKEIGTEKTPAEYIEKLAAVFRDVRRVLHPTGVAFLNLGDSYASSGASGPNSGLAALADRHAPRVNPRNPNRDDLGHVPRPAKVLHPGYKAKDLMMIPARVAIALQDDGWHLRSDIIWAKPNPMPESTQDRPTAAHEHVFLLTKQPDYFWDTENGKETATSIKGSGNKKRRVATELDRSRTNSHLGSSVPWQPTEKRNMRNVWTITKVAYKGAHFATFPPEIPRRAIATATSDAGCCPYCRAPYERHTVKGAPDLDHQRACGGDTDGEYDGQAVKEYESAGAQNASDVKRRILEGMRERITIGWFPSCSCSPAPPIPCLVLDPFGGSGTTAMVAQQLGRNAITIDLNTDYATITRDRLTKAGLASFCHGD